MAHLSTVFLSLDLNKSVKHHFSVAFIYKNHCRGMGKMFLVLQQYVTVPLLKLEFGNGRNMYHLQQSSSCHVCCRAKATFLKGVFSEAV